LTAHHEEKPWGIPGVRTLFAGETCFSVAWKLCISATSLHAQTMPSPHRELLTEELHYELHRIGSGDVKPLRAVAQS